MEQVQIEIFVVQYLCSLEWMCVSLQVRAKALKALNLAHTVGPRSTTFPLEDIVRILMFRNAAEATDFTQQYGLNVNDEWVSTSGLIDEKVFNTWS